MSEPNVALFWGEDEFLLRDAARAFLDANGVRATEVDARRWVGGEMSDLATPSLWGERRGLFIAGCQALPPAGVREVNDYLRAPGPDAVCVLTLITRGRSTPPLAKAVQGAGGLVRQVAVRRQDLPKWIVDRARGKGVRLAGPAAAALVSTVGEDPAVLDQAVEQLITAFPGRPIGPDEVHAQFRGLGEQRTWDLCDQAFAGNIPAALVTLRSLLEARDDPLLILGGMASRLRDLLRLKTLPERMPAAEAARAAGFRYDWQVRRYREQAKRYTLEEVASLHEQVVDCDRALKGGAPGEVVLPALVASMAGEREARLRMEVRASR